MKPHIFILLASLALLCMPVSAYTLFEQYSVANTSTQGNYLPSAALEPKLYFVGNVSVLQQNAISRIEWDGILRRASAGGTNSGVITGYAKMSTTVCAEAVLTWQVPSTVDTNYYNVSWSLDLSNYQNLSVCKGSSASLVISGSNTGTLPPQTAIQTRQAAAPHPVNTTYFAGANYYPGTYRLYTGSAVNTPVASFSCVPTSQFPNTDVVCTDTSTNTPTDWLWSIDAEAMGIKGWQTSTSQNFTWQSAYSGLYTINLRANNSAGSDWENKTNYVSISANATPNNCNLPKAAGYSRTVFECLDSQTSSAVSGCDIQLRDNEAGAWSNATNRQDGLWCIDTLPSHTINGYGQATGYTSTSTLNLHALDLSEGMYYLLMIPGYVPAAPDGKVYLYVTVNDYDNSIMIPSAYVTASWSGGGYAAATTSATGTAILTVKNSTSIYITATKSGYVSVNRVITTSPFGPDSTTIGLHRMTVQPTATATTGPGGTVAPTVNPYGTTLPSGVMPPGYTNNQGQIMMDFLATNGLGLVQLCFLVTILALLGVKLGK